MKCSYVVYKYTKHENVNCHCKLGHIELLECLHYSKYHIALLHNLIIQNGITEF